MNKSDPKTGNIEHPRYMDSSAHYFRHRLGCVWIGIAFSTVIALPFPQTVSALSPIEDTPEEILRTEIILEARSPVDGEPLSASEYVKLQEDLADPDHPPTLNSETQHLIFLLQIRKFLNIVSPVQVL